MGIKIFSPLSYSEGKLYGLSPSTPSTTTLDLTFARNSTNRTRVSNRGVVQDVPYNLLSFSEEFDNTAWTKTQSTVTPNAVQPPNNPNYTADLVYPTGSTAFIQTSGTTTTASGGTYYFSVYARSAGKNFIMLNGSGGTTGVWYNLSTGVIGTQSAGNGYILNMGNGWYYCVWFGNLTGALQPIIRISDADNSTSNTASGTNGVFLWGAQLSQSTAVQPYFKTTNRLNVPAIDYSLSTGGSGCLLMEPQRTNLVLYSEDFTNVAWQVSTTGLNITNNTYISPSGSLNGNRVTSSGTGVRRLRQNLTNTPNTPFTFSCYVRADTGSELIAIWINDGITSPAVSSVFQTVGTSWVRISCFGTTSASATELSVLIGLHNSTTLGDYKNGSFGLWGAQLEVGRYPTSYIPTTTASATRAADSFTRNSLFSNNYVTAAGGTWFVDLDNNIALARDAADVGLFLGDTATGTTNSFCINTPSGSSRMEIDSYVNGSATTLHVTTTDRTRAAIKWNGSTADVFVNGSKVVSGTTFTGTTLEYMGLNVRDTPKYIRGMWLAPVPLTDADLISATQPPSIVTSGLVLHLDAANPFSYPGLGTTWNDLSGFGNNGTLVSGTTYNSVNSGSMVFDGVNDNVLIPNATSIISTTALTIAMWVRWTTTGTTTSNIQALFDNNHNSSPNRGIVLQDRPDLGKALSFSVNPSGGNGALSKSIVGDGNWKYVVCTYVGAISRIYVNGILEGQATETGIAPIQPNITLGIWQFNNTRALNGAIATTSVYNRALSDTEILQNYNATKARFQVPPVLDLYPNAAAAYSLRKLRSGYTGSAVRVRRSNDNAESDIDFTSTGELNTTALTAFVGANNGFVTTWYDQSGNGNNAIQADSTAQPVIFSGSTVVNINSKPAIDFDGLNDFFTTTNYLNSNPVSLFFVTKLDDPTNTNKNGIFNANTSQIFAGSNGIRLDNFSGNSRWGVNGTFLIASNTSTTRQLRSAFANNISNDLYVNNSLLITGSGSTPNFTSVTNTNIGRMFDSVYLDGIIQEVIIYNSNQSTNKPFIETNINSYYGIYNGIGDSDADAFVNAAGITNLTQQNAINTLVKDLKGFGIWTKMRAIYPFVGGTANSHKFNLKDPRDVDGAFRLQFFGGWTHSATGAKGDGSTGYANTFFVPNSNLSINSGHLSYYSRTDFNEQKYQIGIYVTSPTVSYFDLAIRYSNNTYGAVNSLTESFFSDSVSLGYYLSNRISSSNQTVWKNGIIRINGNISPNILSSLSVFINGANTNTPPYFPSAKECAFATIGDGLTDTEAANLYTAVQKYQTTLGRQV